MNRTILRGSVSALALAMAFGAAAQAQEFETVISTGARSGGHGKTEEREAVKL